MKLDTIKTLTCYPEIFALYGDLFVEIADKPEEEKYEAISRLPIPKSWRNRLPKGNPDMVYSFGYLPTEYWIILLKDRKNILEAARCFESGRVASICLRMYNEENAEKDRAADRAYILSNFDDSPCAGFYWVDILYYRIKFSLEAFDCDAWKTIMECCPFALPKLLAKRPYFARRFAPYEFWKFFDEDDWEYLRKKQPQLLKYKK